MDSFCDTEEKRFRKLIRFSYYNQFIAEKKFLMTGVNNNLELVKDPDSTERTKSYPVNIFPQNASLDMIWIPTSTRYT